MPISAAAAMAKTLASGADQQTMTAAAALVAAWLEGNEAPGPQPRGAFTSSGSARQGRRPAPAALWGGGLEENEAPGPQPRGAFTSSGSARQGRSRATAGFTTRTVSRSAA